MKKSILAYENKNYGEANNNKIMSLINEINVVGNFQKVLLGTKPSKNKMNSLIPDLLEDLKVGLKL